MLNYTIHINWLYIVLEGLCLYLTFQSISITLKVNLLGTNSVCWSWMRQIWENICFISLRNLQKTSARLLSPVDFHSRLSSTFSTFYIYVLSHSFVILLCLYLIFTSVCSYSDHLVIKQCHLHCPWIPAPHFLFFPFGLPSNFPSYIS